MRGVLDAVTERAVPTESAGGHFAGLPVLLDARPWRTRYPGGVVIPQNRLEEVLEDHLRGMGVAVCRGAELTGLTFVLVPGGVRWTGTGNPASAGAGHRGRSGPGAERGPRP
jgi:2-polyprenyl-6-methoxyphenol hydroxylase-like FAD-dependent oxidoreductase